MKTHKQVKMLRNVNKSKLTAYLNKSGSDGWTIWLPSKFTDMGFDLADLPVRKHKSDTSDPKSTIFNNGEVVKELEGVYNLTFLRKLADAVGADTDTGMLGRGSDARVLTQRIQEALKQL
jgi:hypothetical protein